MATNAEVAAICGRCAVWAAAVASRVADEEDNIGSAEQLVYYALRPLREAGVFFVEKYNAQEGAKLILTQSVAGVDSTE